VCGRGNACSGSDSQTLPRLDCGLSFKISILEETVCIVRVR